MSVESFRGAVSTDDQSGSQCAQDVMLELHRTQSAQLRRRSDSPDPFNVEETSETTGGLSRVHSSHALIEVVASQERRQLQAATCADHDLWIRVAFDMLAGGTHSMFRTPSNSLEDRNRRQRSQSPVPDPSATVMVDDLIEVLGSVGLRPDDPRLARLRIALKDGRKRELTSEEFSSLVEDAHAKTLLYRAFSGKLVLPNFPHFVQHLQEIADEASVITSGKVATYIPRLANVDPTKFAVALCTVDGQRWSTGDVDTKFCLQSVCKPLLYLMAAAECGIDEVHRYVGREPSGVDFNELTLMPLRVRTGQPENTTAIPHNPLVNAGAIVTTSMIKPQETDAERFAHCVNVISRAAGLFGDEKVSFDNAVFLSERATAARNFCLAYMCAEANAFPPETQLRNTLDLYFQNCSIAVDVRQLAAIGATLANGGSCPLTGDQVFEPQHVRAASTLMLSCGMYNFSGEWQFTVGLPAKSGVSGGIMLVVPNVGGIAVWSPRLDEYGNSTRGVAFCQKLIEKYSFHLYDSLKGVEREKTNPCRPAQQTELHMRETFDLLWACANGDLQECMRLIISGVRAQDGDWDRRTPLHVAAAHGHIEVVSFLLQYCAVDVNALDRHAKTPLDDAYETGDDAVISLLRSHGGERGKAAPSKRRAREQFTSDDAASSEADAAEQPPAARTTGKPRGLSIRVTDESTQP